MTYESWGEPEVEPNTEDLVDPDFRFSEGTYSWLMEKIAEGKVQMPDLREFLEKHKPDSLRTHEDGFTPDTE